MRHDGVKALARGQWRGILLRLGFPEAGLRARHGPCPFCGGKDRYRWDNKDGTGSYFCSGCGPGSGIDLLMRFKGWDYRTTACELEQLLVTQPSHSQLQRPDPVKPARTAEESRRAVRTLLEHCRPIEAGDFVDRYFHARCIGFADYPDSLLACESCWAGPGLWLPALVQRVVDVDGNTVSLQRTWLENGQKANIESPRRLMNGVTLPAGACVRLSGVRRELCLAEGVETAMSVEKLMDTPCWAALSAAMMRKWEPPPGVEHVTICADNDKNRAGQDAAEAIAVRLRGIGIDVHIRIPPDPHKDWNDVLVKEHRLGRGVG